MEDFMRMWFLNLPDILVFFSIWWAGFLTCFVLMLGCILVYIWGGGSITFGVKTKEDNDIHNLYNNI